MKANVLVNRFEGLAQELNAKNRFAELVQTNPNSDLIFPKTLITPISNERLRLEIEDNEL
jgi:hypothetical protein